MAIDWKIVVENTPPTTSLVAQLTPFLSTLLGAFIAGTTGYVLQRRQFKQQRLVVEQDKLERDEATGFSGMLKINRTLTTLVQVRESIDEGIARCEAPQAWDLWSKVEAFSSDPPRISVTMDELVFVRRLGNVEAMNAMMNLEAINNSYVDNMRAYAELRDVIGRKLVEIGGHEVDGANVRGSYTDEQIAPIKPDMARANKLLLDIRQLVHEHEPVVLELFRIVHDLARKQLGTRSPQFAIPAASEAASPIKA